MENNVYQFNSLNTNDVEVIREAFIRTVRDGSRRMVYYNPNLLDRHVDVANNEREDRAMELEENRMQFIQAISIYDSLPIILANIDTQLNEFLELIAE